MATYIENIHPNMLIWAIQRASHDVNAYLNENDKVRSWVEGEKHPTARQLEEFASKMYVPYGYLFLNAPPAESMPIPLFRGSASSSDMNLNVYETVQTMQYRQEWAEEYIQEELDAEELQFISSMSLQDGVEAVVSKIRELLELDETWAFGERDSASAVNRITRQLESLGVIISFNGVVGNNTHKKLPVEECRGFALVSKIAPFIFINNDDSKNAQLFTLIHEFSHLLLGVSAGFGGIDDHDDACEKFCDLVAANFLVPRLLLIAQWKATDRSIEKCAKKFKVSSLVIARRTYALELLTPQEYQEFYNSYRANWKSHKKSESGSGNFYLSAAKRVGKLFGIYVDTAVKSDYLLHRDAYRLTGLHGASFDKVIATLINR